MGASLGRVTVASPRLDAVKFTPSAVTLLVAVSAVLVGGCSSEDHPSGPRADLSWQEVQLPFPPGPTGRVAVRDATSCDGTWYVVGAVIGDDGSSRPAAWTSSDGTAWRSMAVDPADYWAKRAILSSVACRDGQVAAIGAKSGGAHANPRTSSWYQRADGALVDMRATFVLYGGSQAVSVNRIAAGPEGWLIGGNRRTGAAVWLSSDATDFRLVDDDPALSSDAALQTAALDQVHDGAGWTVVGRAALPGRISPVPMAWTSPDGLRWQRQEVRPGTDGYADLERVIRVDDDVLAAGIRGERFGTWRRANGRWKAHATFGALDQGGSGAPFVSGLASASDHPLATASDGTRFHLWADLGDGWHEVATPTHPDTAGDQQLTVAAASQKVLLLADDGRSGRIWLADLG
jgi:hypothetical protein